MLNDIIYIMDKRLNDHGKNWRHVYKTLVLLEYMICCGSDMVVKYAHDRIYMIGTLKEFQHVDQQGFDQGGNVRNKSRDIVDLLSDEAALQQARANRSVSQFRRRSQEPLTISPKICSQSNSTTFITNGDRRSSFDDLQTMDEDVALALALKESKELHEKNQSMKSQSKSLDPSQVYPNFLDNVSRASLARSSVSLNNNHSNVLPSGSSLNNLPNQEATVTSLLDLDDGDYAPSNCNIGTGPNSQDIFDLYTLNQPMTNSTTSNPFTNEQFPMSRNPFDTHHSNVPISSSTWNVPMPMALGQAPINHVSIGANNIGAKPVMPHQMAPQFGYTPNQSQDNAEHDPFAQL